MGQTANHWESRWGETNTAKRDQQGKLKVFVEHPPIHSDLRQGLWELREKWKRCRVGLGADVTLDLLTNTLCADFPGFPATAEV